MTESVVPAAKLRVSWQLRHIMSAPHCSAMDQGNKKKSYETLHVGRDSDGARCRHIQPVVGNYSSRSTHQYFHRGSAAGFVVHRPPDQPLFQSLESESETILTEYVCLLFRLTRSEKKLIETENTLTINQKTPHEMIKIPTIR